MTSIAYKLTFSNLRRMFIDHKNAPTTTLFPAKATVEASRTATILADLRWSLTAADKVCCVTRSLLEQTKLSLAESKLAADVRRSLSAFQEAEESVRLASARFAANMHTQLDMF